MTPYEFDRSFEKLTAMRSSKVTDAFRGLWFTSCEKLPEIAFRKACDAWVEDNSRFPTIREIKELAWSLRPFEARQENAPEAPLTAQEEAFNRLQIPVLNQWMRGEINRDAYLGLMKLNAYKVGLVMNWDAFEKPVPWDMEDESCSVW